jgi:hypothetical protein
MYKNNSWFSSKLESCSPLSLYSGLKVELPNIGYYSYTNR